MATTVQGQPPATGVVKAPKEAPLVALLGSDLARARIEPFLPEGVKIERVIASAQLAAIQNPAIALCTPESLVLAVARILSWGLEIGQTAHLVPYGKVATPIADYKGLCELMVGSGAVLHVEAHAVFEADQFDYELGLNAFLTHRPSTLKERGKVVAAYVILHLRGGRKPFDVMNIHEIDAIRNTYSKQWTEAKAGACPPWYACKCVVRRISKTVPKNPRLAKVLAIIDEDERAEFGQEVASIAAPAGTLLGPGDETPRAPSAPPDVSLCATCQSVEVEGAGEMCKGCSDEWDKVQAANAGGELPLGDVKPAKGSDALRQG